MKKGQAIYNCRIFYVPQYNLSTVFVGLSYKKPSYKLIGLGRNFKRIYETKTLVSYAAHSILELLKKLSI